MVEAERMTITDKLALLALLLAMFVLPAVLGALQQGQQRQPTTPCAVAGWQAPTATPRRHAGGRRADEQPVANDAGRGS